MRHLSPMTDSPRSGCILLPAKDPGMAAHTLSRQSRAAKCSPSLPLPKNGHASFSLPMLIQPDRNIAPMPHSDPQTFLREPDKSRAEQDIPAPRSIRSANAGDAALHPESRPPSINTKLVAKQIVRRTRGVAQKMISLDRFHDVALPLPTPAEQHQIVAKDEAAPPP